MAWDTDGIPTPEEAEEITNEGDKLTGRVHDESTSFDGTGEDDAKARRLARGTYTESDLGEPTTAPDNAVDYDTSTDEGLRLHVEQEDRLGEERHEDWHQTLNWLKQYLTLEYTTPEKIRGLMAKKGFGEHWYQVAKGIERDTLAKAPSMADVDKMTAQEFAERLAEWTKTARSRRDEDEPEVALTRSEMKRLNDLPIAEFERALNALKARGR
jgi:hypothetical protein